jgi:hypothetical protein
VLTATLKDIAQKVERSVTTVFRVLADYDDVFGVMILIYEDGDAFFRI